MFLNIFFMVVDDVGLMEVEFFLEIRGWKNKYIDCMIDFGCIINYFIWLLNLLRKENSDKYVI